MEQQTPKMIVGNRENMTLSVGSNLRPEHSTGFGLTHHADTGFADQENRACFSLSAASVRMSLLAIAASMSNRGLGP